MFCRGSNECASKKMDYKGISSCKAVANQFGGTLDCRFGCIGLGDCVKACEFGGITVRDGVAVVDTKSCVACGQCVTACPKGLISLVPARKTPLVLCSSRDSGAITRKACTAGCIGCKMCEKACESDAIKVVDFRAVVDFEKCTGCGKCVAVCPMRLQPLYMYRFTNAGRTDELKRLNILDCIECGSCAFTCPGKLPLVETFRKGKQMVREADAK